MLLRFSILEFLFSSFFNLNILFKHKYFFSSFLPSFLFSGLHLQHMEVPTPRDQNGAPIQDPSWICVFFVVCLFFITQWIYYIYSCTMIITIQLYRISIPQSKHIPPTPKLSPPETINFSMSVSQHLFCKEVPSFFRFHMSVIAFDVGVSFFDWLHLAW